MRIRFKPTSRQRSALRAQLARFRRPAEVVETLRRVLPVDFKPGDVTCSPESVHSDRFVVRVRVRPADGRADGYALKVYSDDFVGAVWEHSRSLLERVPADHEAICLPSAYIAGERMLVFPWVEGTFLSGITDGRKPRLLRRAARLAARLHGSGIVPEAPTTALMMVRETRARCRRLRRRWPRVAAAIGPPLAMLAEAEAALDPAGPAPVHGDLAAGQFLWTGERLVLLDLDMFGYADPAYDVGHFLAQLERRCLFDKALRRCARTWTAAFCETYRDANPGVSGRNITFYRGLTLLRKVYTVCRKQPAGWEDMAPLLAARALEVLRAAAKGRRFP